MAVSADPAHHSPSATNITVEHFVWLKHHQGAWSTTETSSEATGEEGCFQELLATGAIQHLKLFSTSISSGLVQYTVLENLLSSIQKSSGSVLLYSANGIDMTLILGRILSEFGVNSGPAEVCDAAAE